MKRNLNIEVLRCFLMLVVVVYHGCNNGPFAVDGQNHDVKFGAWLLYWATNAFVFISGWYGIKFSWERVGKFLGMGLYASIVLFLLSPLAIGRWHYRFSMGWFGNSYLALMLVAPIINEGLLAIERKSIFALLSAYGAYAVAMLLSWLPIVELAVPGWFGHSFNTMLFIYVSAHVLKRMEWFASISRTKAICVFLIAQCFHVLFVGATVVSPWCRANLAGADDYNSPWVLVMGSMMFMIFLKTEFPKWLQRFCAFLAPSVFMVYLLHSGACNSLVARRIFNGVLLYCDNWLSPMPLHGIFAVVCGGFVIFFAAIVADMPRRVISFLTRRENLK